MQHELSITSRPDGSYRLACLCGAANVAFVRDARAEAAWFRGHLTEETWDTAELQEAYEVLGFQAPFVVVRRKADGALGSLEFSNHPRLYWGWTGDLA